VNVVANHKLYDDLKGRVPIFVNCGVLCHMLCVPCFNYKYSRDEHYSNLCDKPRCLAYFRTPWLNMTESATQCELESFDFYGEFPLTMNYKCQYCGLAWILRVKKFEVGNDLQVIDSRRLCRLCAEEERSKIFNVNISGNPWRRRLWLKRTVLLKDFHCCLCIDVTKNHSLTTNSLGMFTVYTFTYFESHRFCGMCFENLFREMRAELNPGECLVCVHGPLSTGSPTYLEM